MAGHPHNDTFLWHCLPAGEQPIVPLDHSVFMGTYGVTIGFVFFLLCYLGWRGRTPKQKARVRMPSFVDTHSDVSRKISHSLSPPTTPSEGPSSTTIDVPFDDTSNHLVQTGYKAHWLGSLNFVVILLFGFALFCVMIMCTMDIYGYLATKKRKHYMGNNESTAATFLIFWMVFTIWICVVKAYKHRIMNFCRARCSLAQASVVEVWRPALPPVPMRPRPGLISGIRDKLDRIGHFFSSEWDRGVADNCTVETNENGQRYFVYKCLHYMFDPLRKEFCPRNITIGPTVNDILKLQRDGLTQRAANHHIAQIGHNRISVPLRSLGRTILDEMLSYFYIYQVVVVWIWFFFDWSFVASLHITMIFGAAGVKIYISRANEQSIHEMTKLGELNIRVKRDGQWVDVAAEDLVPGDLLDVAA
eukprot:847057_1